MDGIVSVACFSNGTYVANLNCIGVGLSLNCIADVFSSADICFLCSVRLSVSCGRNHTANVENVVCAVYSVENILVLGKVAPNDSN